MAMTALYERVHLAPKSPCRQLLDLAMNGGQFFWSDGGVNLIMGEKFFGAFSCRKHFWPIFETTIQLCLTIVEKFQVLP